MVGDVSGVKGVPLEIQGLIADAPYASRLSARSAMYSELRLLLGDWETPLSSSDYRSTVVDENRLARPSMSARKKLWKELHSRYRLHGADPLFAAFWAEWRRSDSEVERALTTYVLWALNDRLAADLGTQLLFRLLRQAPADLKAEDVLLFLQSVAQRHPEIVKWTSATTRAVATKYCASIRDFGLARGIVRKLTVRPALYGSPVRLLIRALRMVGTPPLELLQESAFRLVGIDTFEVVDAFSELNRMGALRFRMQADVVELDLLEDL